VIQVQVIQVQVQVSNLAKGWRRVTGPTRSQLLTWHVRVKANSDFGCKNRDSRDRPSHTCAARPQPRGRLACRAAQASERYITSAVIHQFKDKSLFRDSQQQAATFIHKDRKGNSRQLPAALIYRDSKVANGTSLSFHWYARPCRDSRPNSVLMPHTVRQGGWQRESTAADDAKQCVGGRIRR
jgi:hypothetical protein